MVKWILLAVVILVVLAALAWFWMMKGPDVAQYEFLKQPRITEKPDTPVLEVPFEVDSQGLRAVFGVLFKTYFKLKGVPKGPGMPAPAARYDNTLDWSLSPEERAEKFKNVAWKGSAALPVPGTVQKLPDVTAVQGLQPRISVWHYGEVVEILHVGPYETEPPTIQKLLDFVKTQGYEIAGLHEEEYLRGPGMPWVKPENYYTIIRYPVKRKAGQ